MEMKKTKRLFDIAANLSDHQYHPKTGEVERVIKRAAAVGVTHLLLAGGHIKDSIDSHALCVRFPHCYTTVGIHPCRATEPKNDLKGYLERTHELFSQLKDKVVAVGECGLDFDRLDYADKESQLRVFPPHFDWAEEFGLPMYLHSRACEKEFLQILKENFKKMRGGVVHSFTGSLSEAKELLAMGLYIGVNGCSLKTKENLEVVKQIPVDMMMLETDSPYCEIRKSHESFSLLSKQHFVSKPKEKAGNDFLVKGRNEPCKTIEVLEIVAKLKGVSEEELAEKTFLNACKLFKVPEK